ncbi:DUF4402 domain-containing protein [Bdellovibrio bacteriovorus]|uniref:DUF4402 domain-containing protein n=1 Tax=Bdellovibrio bacteriovorus TaxID=959 RepID=UPI0035A8A9D6
MKIQLISASLLLMSLGASAAPNFGDSASAVATQRIVHRLQISKVSDLNFGEASPGDGPVTVMPGVSENTENASFEVRGEPSRLYQIILPANNSVKMLNGNGGADREILIKEFLSFPARAGTLDGTGKSMIFVGAKRDAISNKQKVGDYIGQFYITVVY